MTTPAIDVRSVSKHFAGVRALDGVSLELHPGEVHALVGENGAGKSTLIKLVTGVYRPDAGEVRYLGEPVTFAHPREAQAAGISTIYQEVNLVPMRSVAGNLYLGREPLNRFGLIDFRRMHREAAQILAGYGITVDVRRRLGELGLGVQQMIAVARALSTDARVVVMDEPTSSLEPREVDLLLGVVALLRSRQVAVLYVTHKLDEVFQICDRVTVLRDGRLVHTGPVATTTRLRLVATMLGRDVDRIRRHGATAFSDRAAGHRAASDRVASDRVASDRVASDRVASDRAAGTPVLRADGLTRRPLLDDVSVEVHAGEVVGLAGLLGSGRTETAKAVFGAGRLDAGTVSVDGVPARRWNPAAAIRGGIGMVPEDRKSEGIVGDLSVRDNIVLAALPGLTTAGFVSRHRQDRIVDTFIERLQIKASSPDQRVRELSGGNQQKVLLARMLCLSPKVLILDEPTRGIDVGAKAEIQSLISELAELGLGVLLVSSELEEVVEGAGRVLVLRDGAVVGMLRGDDISEDRIMRTIAQASGDDQPSRAPAAPRGGL